MIRIALASFAFIGTLFLSPWLWIIAAVLLALRWAAWEVLLIGLFADLLYLPPGGFFGVPFAATLAAFVLVWGCEPLRRSFLE